MRYLVLLAALLPSLGSSATVHIHRQDRGFHHKHIHAPRYVASHAHGHPKIVERNHHHHASVHGNIARESVRRPEHHHGKNYAAEQENRHNQYAQNNIHGHTK